MFPNSSKLRTLIDRYSGHIPRYTSYPTAVEFNTQVNPASWEKALQKEFLGSEAKKEIALYAHIPFCHSLCYYCACNKKIVQDDSLVSSYLEALSIEIKKYRSLVGENYKVNQLHWGGGTPNFLSQTASEDLFSFFSDSFPCFSKDADISVEVDPRTLEPSHIETYKRLGFNRISAGVQDFNIDVQKAINRIQPYEQTRDMCEHARSLGFSSINLDLIYGLPNQDETTFSDTIEKVIELRPNRIALYGYAHVTWKNKSQKSLQRHLLPKPETRINLFLLALKALNDAGYIYIGMDHFALPDDSLSKALNSGKLNRNFMGYSTHKDVSVLGVGVSSISSIPWVIAQNSLDLEAYQKQAINNDFPVQRGIARTSDDRLRGDLIESILCGGVVKKKEFERKWGINFNEYFSSGLSKLEHLADDNLVTFSDSTIQVTKLGRLFMRNIASQFDAYLDVHKNSDKKTFSQSL